MYGFLGNKIGPKKAREMWFLCRFYDAYEAEKMGLVNVVVPVIFLLSLLNSLQNKIIFSFKYLLQSPALLPHTEHVFLPLQLEKLELETLRWCREILRNSPTAIRVLKSALNAVDDGHAGLQVSCRCSISYMYRNSLILFLKDLKTFANSFHVFY